MIAWAHFFDAVFLLLVILQGAAVGLDLNTARTPGGTQLPISRPAELPKTFLPLCGNGRLDTIADYKKLAAAEATFTWQPDASKQSLPITLYADEVCDDGNRQDHDGCSADCMHRDLWVSSCELQLDIPSSNLEALVYVPAWQEALLSRADGLYGLQVFPQPSDTALRTHLLVTKDFAVSSAFVSPKGDVLVYSATQQKLWKYSAGKLTVFLDLSGQLASATYTAFQFPEPNAKWVVMHDDHSVAAVDLDLQRVVGTARVDASLDLALYLSSSGSTLIMSTVRFNGRVTVEVHAGGITASQAFPQTQQSTPNNIWNVAFEKLYSEIRTDTVPYRMEHNLDSALWKPSFMRMFVPIGLWLEIPFQSPRNLLPNAGNQAIGLSSYVGDPYIMRAAWDAKGKLCSSNARCVFDVSTSYDLFRPSTAGPTWQQVLQGVIDKRFQDASSIAALYTDQGLYNRLVGEWSTAATPYLSAARMLLGTLENPKTGNLWALRSDGLFEVSRSGVQVRLPTAKCMPSGLALCPACQWAPAGQACRPCTTRSEEWAWYVKCPGSSCSIGRRLLSESAPVIEFTTRGEVDVNATCMQGASNVTDIGGGLRKVRVSAEDPAACMRELVPQLLGVAEEMPFVALQLRPSDSGSGSSQPLPAGTIAGSAVAGTLALVLLICVGMHYLSAGKNRLYRPLQRPI